MAVITLNTIETIFRLKAEEGLKALDSIVEKSKAADKKLASLTTTADSVGKKLGIAGAAITAAFAFAIKGADAEAQSLAQLEGTVNSTGASFEAQRPKIEAFIQGLAKTSKFSDDQLIPALNRAVAATNDVDKAFQATNLAARVADAGIGSLDGNVRVITKLFEGQARAIGSLIPEFRDLDERIEAGASEADIAAEALSRLNAIAANAPGPSSINALTKAIGELGDSIGAVALKTLDPFIVKLTAIVESIDKFSQTTAGNILTNVALFAGAVATLGGGLLILSAQLITSSTAIKIWAVETGAAAGAAKALGAILSPTGAVLIGLGLLAAFVAKAAIELNALSKASDEARDKAFDAPRVAQFAAEMNALRSAIAGLEKGTLSAADAQDVFNRFGVANLEEAEQRVGALGRIVDGLKKQKEEQAAVAKTEEERAARDAERKRIEGVIAALGEEKQKRIENEILAEKFAEEEARRGQALVDQTVPATGELPPQGGFAQEGLDALREPGGPVDNSLSGILDSMDVFIEKTGTIEERLGGVIEKCNALDDALTGIVAGGLEQLASIGGTLFSDIAFGIEDAGAKARQFFGDLARQLTGAIARALILQAIIGAVGGPTSKLGGFLSKMFQDPVADQLARFEGSRFVDLFFQGLTSQFSNARDRIDSALVDTRDINKTNGNGNMSVIVTEATPETAVEFTDRKIEPRVRARARQRTGNVTDPFGATA